MLKKQKLVLLGFVLASVFLTLGVSFFKAKKDAQDYLSNTFFEGFKKQTGGLFYMASTHFPIKGTLVDKTADAWTIQPVGNNAIKAQLTKDVISLQTTSDYQNVATWKLISPEVVSKGDQVVLTVYLNLADNQLHITSVKKIVQ